MTDEKVKPLCGFLNLLKPPGMTSSQAVGYARRLLDGAKVGHGGTLDPEAAGVLPLMVGKAARLFDYMQEKEKAYVTEVAFGAATDTQDAQGRVVATGERFPSEEEIRRILPSFCGELMQRPPMYSALKQDGKRLYELARSGKSAEIPERPVTVYELRLERMTPNRGALLYVKCSKGFYVRTLCNDLGEALGCPSHMRFLLRAQSGSFTLKNAVTLERLARAKENGELADMLLPPETALKHMPWARTPKRLEKALRNGGKLPASAFPELLSQEEGANACLWLGDEPTAIARRQGEEWKVRAWLGE